MKVHSKFDNQVAARAAISFAISTYPNGDGFLGSSQRQRVLEGKWTGPFFKYLQFQNGGGHLLGMYHTDIPERASVEVTNEEFLTLITTPREMAPREEVIALNDNRKAVVTRDGVKVACQQFSGAAVTALANTVRRYQAVSTVGLNSQYVAEVSSGGVVCGGERISFDAILQLEAAAKRVGLIT